MYFISPLTNSYLVHSMSTTCVFTGEVLQYTVAMMGYGPEEKNAVLELTYHYGVSEYTKGNAYAQVRDVDCLHLDQLNNS